MDGQTNQEQQKQTIDNETPAFVKEKILQAILLVEKYGWFFLFGVIVTMFLVYKLRPHYKRWKKKREEEEDLKKFDMNKAFEQQESVDAARNRMQELYNSKAEVHAEEQKKREEERRKELIEDWENHKMGKGYKSKLKNKTQKDDSSQPAGLSKPKKPLKPLRDNDYNPLTGGGGGSSYRPSSRGGRGGGG